MKTDEASPRVPSDAKIAEHPVERLGDISSQQWRSGLAAWLGWMFDGLDMHLYTLVSIPFVAELMGLSVTDPQVSQHGRSLTADSCWDGRSAAASSAASAI